MAPEPAGNAKIDITREQKNGHRTDSDPEEGAICGNPLVDIPLIATIVGHRGLDGLERKLIFARHDFSFPVFELELTDDRPYRDPTGENAAVGRVCVSRGRLNPARDLSVLAVEFHDGVQPSLETGSICNNSRRSAVKGSEK
jgi:hypothetical protein